MSHGGPLAPPLDDELEELDDELDELDELVPDEPELLEELELLDVLPESWVAVPASAGESGCDGGGSFTVLSSAGAVAFCSEVLLSIGSTGEVAQAPMRATSDRTDTAVRAGRSMAVLYSADRARSAQALARDAQVTPTLSLLVAGSLRRRKSLKYRGLSAWCSRARCRS
jgi:hypothetical protein